MPDFYRVTHTLTLQDANGDEAQMRYHAWIPAGGEAPTTIDALIADSTAFGTAVGLPGAGAGALTNAKVVRRTIEILADQAQPGGVNPAVDAPFPSVTQKARLQFADNEGYAMGLSIPAPVDAIFLAPPSDEVVSRANTAVARLIAFIGTHAEAYPGDVTFMNLYKGGVFVGQRSRSRKSRFG